MKYQNQHKLKNFGIIDHGYDIPKSMLKNVRSYIKCLDK
jgi:hypothetical protein